MLTPQLATPYTPVSIMIGTGSVTGTMKAATLSTAYFSEQHGLPANVHVPLSAQFDVIDTYNDVTMGCSEADTDAVGVGEGDDDGVNDVVMVAVAVSDVNAPMHTYTFMIMISVVSTRNFWDCGAMASAHGHTHTGQHDNDKIGATATAITCMNATKQHKIKHSNQ